MSHWAVENAIDHAWKELRAMPLSLSSPALPVLLQVFESLMVMHGMVPTASLPAFKTFFESRLEQELIMLKLTDATATTDTVADVIGGFADAGI